MTLVDVSRALIEGIFSSDSPLSLLTQAGNGQWRGILRRIVSFYELAGNVDLASVADLAEVPDPSWTVHQPKIGGRTKRSPCRVFRSSNNNPIILAAGQVELLMGVHNTTTNTLIAQGQCLPATFDKGKFTRPVVTLVARASGGCLWVVVVDLDIATVEGDIYKLTKTNFPENMFKKPENGPRIPAQGVCFKNELKEAVRRGLQLAASHWNQAKDAPQAPEKNDDDDEIMEDPLSPEDLRTAGRKKLPPGESAICKAQEGEIEALKRQNELLHAEIKRLKKELSNKGGKAADSNVHVHSKSVGQIVEGVSVDIKERLDSFQNEFVACLKQLSAAPSIPQYIPFPMHTLPMPASQMAFPQPPLPRGPEDDRPKKKSKKSKKEDKRSRKRKSSKKNDKNNSSSSSESSESD